MSIIYLTICYFQKWKKENKKSIGWERMIILIKLKRKINVILIIKILRLIRKISIQLLYRLKLLEISKLSIKLSKNNSCNDYCFLKYYK